jgi:hypothetical protein
MLFPATVCASNLAPPVPIQYLGEWNANLSDCGIRQNDSTLRIKKNQIIYYESNGLIKALVSRGRHEIALILELTGEGEAWIATEHFKLSPDEDKLISTEDEFVRYRCPSTKNRDRAK